MLEASLAKAAFNLRFPGVGTPLPAGKCVYIQSGDSSDFDGYLIAKAGELIAQDTADFETVIVVPERRACPDRAETDTNKHVQAYSEVVLATAEKLVRAICPSVTIIRGPLNEKNVIPLRFVFSEPEQYSPLLPINSAEVQLDTIPNLARRINSDSTTSVIIDMHGAVGYLDELVRLCPTLGPKIKNSGLPLVVMAGVLAEEKARTLSVPGRDPRSTMNAIYYSPQTLLDLAKTDDLPLMFVTNNMCARMFNFHDAKEVVQGLGLQGLLRQMAEVWYGPHLTGKCVPFDWVSMAALLLVNRWPHLVTIEKRELYVGTDEPSVLVLRSPTLPIDDITKLNLDGTYLWGVVDSVVDVNLDSMITLAKLVSIES